MIKKTSYGKYIISAGEVGIYTVCPYSWKLKSILKKEIENVTPYTTQRQDGKKGHSKWGEKTENIHILTKKKSLVIKLFITIILMGLLFLQDKITQDIELPKSLNNIIKEGTLLEKIAHDVIKCIYQLASIDIDVLIFVLLIMSTLIVIDVASLYIKKELSQSGIKDASSFLSIDGSSLLPVKNYVSEIQGIAGKPDAVIKEKGNFVPIEIKPLAKKLKDRYVFQLLVYMRLLNEFERTDIPYGYLILGENSKRVRINNLPARQKQLTEILDKMREILEGKVDAIATPDLSKCSKCTVKKYCEFKQEEKI